MGVVTCTIGGIPYLVKNDKSILADRTLEVRGLLTITIIDFAGAFTFQRGDPIVVSDSDTGPFYRGFVQSDQRMKYGPASPAVDHVLTCFDKGKYLFDKGGNTTNYTGWYAGDIVTDFVINQQPGQEGATIAAALHRDSTQTGFNTGILSNTTGTLTVGDGCLELAAAGSDVAFSESTTADFSTGTLSNCSAVNNTLVPITQNALKFSVFLPLSAASSFFGKFWTGTQVVGVGDKLIFDVWVSDSSPVKTGGIVPLFSDNTVPGGLYDQNLLLNDAVTDLSNYAVNKWYTRQVDLSAYSGKTVVGMLAQCGGAGAGTYTWYIKNAYLSSHSGSKFFSTTQTTPTLNPPTVYQVINYVPSTFTTTVVASFDPSNTYRIGPSQSIDAVKLLKSSLIMWNASENVAVYATYNGGSSWIPCTNGVALPGLPVGSNVAGLSMQLKEVFSAGNDPTDIPVLDSVTVSLSSAPNATKSDVVTSFLTQTNWNGGTHSGTQADVSGNLELAPYSRDWNDNTTTGQTSFFPSGTSQSASGGIYTMSMPTNDTTGDNGFGTSRMDQAGTMLDFTIDCDIKSSHQTTEAGITYRQIFWNASVNNTFGYFVGAYAAPNNFLEIGYGSNSNSSSYTQLAGASISFPANTFKHLKIVVNGNRHSVYWDNATTPIIDILDSTYTQAGGIGLRGYNGDGTAAHSCAWDNFVLGQAPSGTWTGPSTSVSSLGTCGGSVITWQETGTDNPAAAYAFVQSSIDGGSTYQQCVNGQPVPGLTNGVSLSGKSVKIQVLLGTQTNTVPMVSGLVWRVLSQYPGSSGTRSTKPLGIDYIDRGNQSGFGTASDGQTWTPTGTGTPAVASNALTIANTTGDFIELLGTRTGADMDETISFTLSASTIPAGLVMRYVDSTHYYKLQASTTAISIIKRNGGTTTTLATAAVTLTANAPYWLRFRIVGAGPINFYGKVWDASGATVEPTAWNVTALE